MANLPGRHAGADTQQLSIAALPADPKRLAEIEWLHIEILEARAPAAEGPIVDRGRRWSGRLVFGDAAE